MTDTLGGLLSTFRHTGTPFEFMRQYFDGSDDGSVVWWMTYAAPVPALGPLLNGSVRLSAGNRALTVADPFAGREPQLVNFASIQQEEIQVGLRPTLILDSQVVTYLHRFVSTPSTLRQPEQLLMSSMLRFAIETGLDYNPYFYFLEAGSRSDSRVLPHMHSTARSLLSLHTMNTDVFLESGEITMEHALLAPYEEEYNARGFEDVAAKYAVGFARDAHRSRLHQEGPARLSYLALLNAVSVKVDHPSTTDDNVSRNIERFARFLSKWQINMPIEFAVAVCYFAGALDSFLPFQHSASATKAFSRLNAAVWDLIFLKSPAILLGSSSQQEILVGYPATCDDALTKILMLIKYELVCMFAGQAYPSPIVSICNPAIEKLQQRWIIPRPVQMIARDPAETEAAIATLERSLLQFLVRT